MCIRDRNKANLFTGWADVDLSEKGTQQAIDAGKLIKEAGIEFDQAYTCLLYTSRCV